MNKVFSIITPVYNAENKIGKTLESIVKQEKDLYEYIIIDGGSTDGTLNIVKEFKSRYPDNIKWFSEPDQGIYDGMNKGIDLATGEYLYFIGAGDRLKPDVLRKVRSRLDFKLELVYGDVFHEEFGYRLDGEYSKKKVCFQTLQHQSMFYHKNIFAEIGKYSLKYKVAADWEFDMKCFGEDIIKKRYIDLVIANYEGYGFSTKRNDISFQKDKESLILKYLGKYYANYYRSSQCKVWLNKNFIDFIKNNDKLSVVIFGSGNFGQNVYKYIEVNNIKYKKKVNVKYFIDNSVNKWDTLLYGKKILEPTKKIFDDVNNIIIATAQGKISINKQLLNMGIDDTKIVSAV